MFSANDCVIFLPSNIKVNLIRFHFKNSQKIIYQKGVLQIVTSVSNLEISSANLSNTFFEQFVNLLINNNCPTSDFYESKKSEAVVNRCSVKKWPATLLKKRLLHNCFPLNFVKFLRTAFFIEHLWWLLLRSKIKTPHAASRFHFRPANLVINFTFPLYGSM